MMSGAGRRNQAADDRFRVLATEMSLAPDDPWVGGYVEYEWRHVRHLLDGGACGVRDKVVLEFGCNLGATAIVCARLGATVKAVDVDPRAVELGRANAERYGVAGRIEFIHVSDSARLPFGPNVFDVICCNSVLDLLRHDQLGPVQRELDRVLKDGGVVLITGTSNRLWPLEVHSSRWFVNYVPRRLDRFLSRSPQRGAWPWTLRRGFATYDDLVRRDRGRALLRAKRRMDASRGKRWLLATANALANACHLSVGMFLPCITLILQKRR